MRVEMANMARMAATACLEVGQIPHLLLERGSVTIMQPLILLYERF